MSVDYDHLTANLIQSNASQSNFDWFKKTFKLNVEVLIIFDSFENIKFINTFFVENFNLDSEFFDNTFFNNSKAFDNSPLIISEILDNLFETTIKYFISKEIIVYETQNIQTQLIQMIQVYFHLWQNIDRTINILKVEWMFIILKSDAKVDSVKIYFLRLLDREFLNKKFDKFHDQNKMKYIIQSISFDWSIFVMWRTIITNDQSMRKDRVVVDIKKFNKIAMNDIYSLFLQSDITFNVTRCKYIIVIDVVGFFHQWFVKIENQNKFTIVSHRNPKQFNVTIMNFKNSSLYVQRQINNMFRFYKDYARAYVDNIIIFNKILKEHKKHLHAIFGLLNAKDVTLSFKKFFIEYSIVTFLSQKVDVFNLIIVVDKIDVIKRFDFSYILIDLEL